MYQTGQQVVYGAHGVCTVVGLEERLIDRRSVSYFALQPLEQPQTRFYVPAENAAALAKLRPLMEKQSLLELLEMQDSAQEGWIPDESSRKQAYRVLINNLDPEAMLRAVHNLRIQKRTLTQQGKKFHQCDENFLKDAQRLLRTEVSLVLEIPESEADAYL